MIQSKAPNLNHVWAGLIVEELVRQGAGYFVLPPGSRSAPLISAVAGHPAAQNIKHFDERGAAFHVLGWARAAGRPAVLITTSGTAAANAWPAVVEASMDRVPMILITADRPVELRDTGANQTIDQVKIFAPYVRWQFDMPCPDQQIPPQMILTTIDQAVYQAKRSPQGPVHLNCMFREPLAPTPDGRDYNSYLAGLSDWGKTREPFTSYPVPTAECTDSDLKRLAAMLNNLDRGLVVIGCLAPPVAPASVHQLVKKLGWPVVPDISSGLRLGNPQSPMIPHYEALLASSSFVEHNRVKAVLHLGGKLISKRLTDYLARCQPQPYIVVEDHPMRADPQHSVSLRLDGRIGRLCGSLISHLNSSQDTSWLAGWRRASERAGQALERVKTAELSEPLVARCISKHIGPEHGLFLAASMPVRHMNTFGLANGHAALIGGNRGASGIDGVLATATGFARGLQRPVTVLMGDLALLHDLNSLNLLRSAQVAITVVVLNNNGGGIFSFLPIAQYPEVFESYFGTPHGLTFEDAARMFGVPYEHPSTEKSFAEVYRSAIEKQNCTLIEVTTQRQVNYEIHGSLLESMVSDLEGV